MSWVLIRELEVRSSHPESHAGARYEGPLLPAILLLVPFALYVLLGRGAEIVLGLGPFAYAVYTAMAATRLGAGAFVVDEACLRYLPASPWQLFWGKLVGSLAALWLEVVLATPVLVCIALFLKADLTRYVVLLLGLVLWHGLWGLLCSVRAGSLREALGSAVSGSVVMIVLAPGAALAVDPTLLLLNPPLAAFCAMPRGVPVALCLEVGAGVVAAAVLLILNALARRRTV